MTVIVLGIKKRIANFKLAFGGNWDVFCSNYDVVPRLKKSFKRPQKFSQITKNNGSKSDDFVEIKTVVGYERIFYDN